MVHNGYTAISTANIGCYFGVRGINAKDVYQWNCLAAWTAEKHTSGKGLKWKQNKFWKDTLILQPGGKGAWGTLPVYTYKIGRDPNQVIN